MKKQVLVFLALTFGITWSIDAFLVAADASKAAITLSRMWGPGLAAIFTSLIFNRSIKQLGLSIQNK